MASKRRQGKLWESNIRLSLKYFQDNHPGFYFQRLMDYQDYVATNPYLRAPHQPADFLAVYRGKCYLLEAKSFHGNRFVMDWLRNHQKQALQSFERAGGISYILFSLRHKRPSLNFAWRIFHYLELERLYIGKRKSIPGTALTTQPGVQLKRIVGKGVLDLSPLFQ